LKLSASSTPPPKEGLAKDTAILVYKVYFDGFKAMDLGGSAAQSVVLMAIRHQFDGAAISICRTQGELLTWLNGIPF